MTDFSSLASGHGLGDRAGRGDRGGGAGARRDPRDRAQLAAYPVSGRRVLALFGPHRWSIAVVLALIVTSSALGLATPFLVKEIVDVAIPEQDVRLLLMLVGAMVGVAVVTSVLGVVQTWVSTTTGQRIMHLLRTDLFTSLQRQPLSFFTRTRSGEVQSRLTHDVSGLQGVVTSTATSLAGNVATVIGTLVAMLALSPTLALLSLVVIPPAVLVTRSVARLRRDATDRRQKALAGLHAQVEESLSVSGARLSKTLGAGEALAQRFTSTSAGLLDLEVAAQIAGRWRTATMGIVFAVVPAALYLVAGLPVTGAGISIGTLVAFTALQAGIFRPVMGLLSVGVQVTASMALFSRIFEYLDLPVEVPEPAPARARHLDPATARGELRLEGVTYRYGGAAAPGPDALRDVDLTIPAGATVALVGATGSGKSTLAALLTRLDDPTRGRVTLDGIDLRDLPSNERAAVVGVVSQETYLLHATIRENLRFARPDATDEQVERAARDAQIHDLVVSLPDGYDTVVGARGHRFSGGEQQRLALARTLLRDPRVLVLDEATSALDTRTEAAIQDALERVGEDRTVVTIAHRLSTVRRADLIVVLDGGRVVERGRHDELLALGGRYAALVAAGSRDTSPDGTDDEDVALASDAEPVALAA
ncbi:ABC transporter ATP-binding protein [Ornithinimicrobium pekingense]|uniref:Multidrug ABC transporter ATP-binding protein n=1 Tax=Ornithinimicrobium pekingense TaxID=384677 RepID=A0ABQ2F4M4_9MICO|nr:ABC transporter ATP-binding protein [Ornithinimicrobium pekingense]GGK58607.1 multidrug ABC transporter ATP-binding protein [Ornithinimicrobium pekingense]